LNLVVEHFKQTKEILESIPKEKIGQWLLEEGYFPEGYVLPPSFKVQKFELKDEPYIDLNDKNKPKVGKIESVSYPKTNLTSRSFGIFPPHHYHDMVYHLINSIDEVINVLFHEDLKIYSYSFPIPINKNNKLSSLRSGRMIYEWITMAEKDLVTEAHSYQYIVRTDITNFYPSIYTHSISWIFNDRKEARKDKEYMLLGNKIDKLLQLANDSKTNGIPVGSALSDLIAELLLARIDRNISNKIKELGIEFLAVRFKDDYRILCNSEEDGQKILKAINECLIDFNLHINEKKTNIQQLPSGLYRLHDREYFQHSLSETNEVSYKLFEKTLLTTLDINEKYPGTSILEKFFSELYKKDRDLKMIFSKNESRRNKEILQVISLLVLAKRKSDKTLCHILAIIEILYTKYFSRELKDNLKKFLIREYQLAINKGSNFEATWLLYFSKYHKLGITPDKSNQLECSLYNSIKDSKQKIYSNEKIELFIVPKKVKEKGVTLAKYIDIFDRK